MRRVHMLFLAMLGPAACGGADTGGKPGADAATSHDAAVTDASPDAAPEVLATCDPAIGQASIFVETDETLVVHCPDGKPSRVVQGTGADVPFDVVAGTMVTLTGDVGRGGLTVFGVTPGQHINPSSGGGGSTTAATAAVSLSNTPVGAASYRVATGCDNEVAANDVTTPINVVVDSGCVEASKFVVLATAFDAGGQPIAYSFAVDVGVGAGTPAVSLSTWQTDFTAATLHLVNAPAPLAGGIGLAGATAGFARGRAGFEVSVLGDSDPIATGASRDIVIDKIPASFADQLLIKTIHGSYPHAIHFMFRRITPVPTDVTVDLTVDPLGLAYALTINGSIPDRPSITWSTSSSLANADALFAYIPSQNGDWELIAPSSAAAPLRLPELPASLASFRPVGPYDQEPSFIAVDIDSVEGYEALLDKGFPAGLNFDNFDNPVGVNQYRICLTGDE